MRLSKRSRKTLAWLKEHMATPLSEEDAEFWAKFERELREHDEDRAVGRKARKYMPILYQGLLELGKKKEAAK